MFVDFDICHRTASLRKLYSLTSTYIFVFKCLKYVNNLFVVVYCQLDKIMKKNKQYTFRHLRSNGVKSHFILRDIYLYFRFQMFKMCEIRAFFSVAGRLQLRDNNSAIHIPSFPIERHKSYFLLRDLDLYFEFFKCLKYVKCVRFRVLPKLKL